MTFKPHQEIRKNTAPCDILFIHGNLASKHWWYPVLEMAEPRFKKMGSQSGSMVVADMRGHGQTENPTGSKLTLEDIINDFISIADENKLKNVLLVGHSAGGLVSAILLARRPDLFVGALLIDPVGPLGLKNVPADIEDKYKMMSESRDVASYVLGLTIHGNDPEKEFFKTTIMNDGMTALNNLGVTLVNALTNIDYSNEISKAKQPVTIFHGTHDWVLDQASATDLQKLMVNSTFVILPDNGHCMNYENPERLLEEICLFISK
ncbi:MAG: alpha/beta hydrolase [Pseudobdellovibrio sp.]